LAGSFAYWNVYVLFTSSVAPLAFASVMNVSVAETEFVYTAAGDQRRAAAVAYACTVFAGVAMMMKMFAPLVRSFVICAATLVAVTSNGSLETMFEAFAPRPASIPVM
jgi:hypothetical protein